MRNSVLFVAGVHGVGKSSLAVEVSKGLSIPAFSASKLIQQADPDRIYPDKLVDDSILENQRILICQVNLLKDRYPRLIIDGHLCLLDQHARVIPLSSEVFKQLGITRLLLVTAESALIKSRLEQRSEIKIDIEAIIALQTQEQDRAQAVANRLCIPLMEYREGENTPKDAIYFFSEDCCL